MGIEKTSAFKLKQKPKAPEARAEQRLGSLESDKQKVAAYNYFLERVSKGQITAPQLERFFDPTYFGNGVLIGPGDVGFIVNGTTVDRKLVEQFRLADADQQVFLFSLDKERRRVADERQTGARTLAGFNYFVPRILKGQITAPQLERFFDPTYFGNGVLIGPGDVGFIVNGTTVDRKLVEQFRITEREQQALLLNFEKERRSAVFERERAARTLDGFNYFVPRLLKGQITAPQLERFFDPTYFGSGVLIGPGDVGFNINGTTVTKSVVEQYRIEDSRLRGLVTEFVSFIDNKSFPDELKKSVEGFLGKEGLRALGRIGQLLESEQKTPLILQFEKWFKRFRAARRRIQFEDDFYKELDKNLPVEDMAEFLGAYEEEDAEDRALVAKLSNAAQVARREKDAVAVASLLEGEKPQREKALALLDKLAKSASPEDQNFARILTKALYREELAAAKEGVVNSINPNVKPDTLRMALRTLPLRAPIDDLDYAPEYANLAKFVEKQLAAIIPIQRLDRANKIRDQFGKDPKEVLKLIDGFPAETEEDLTVKMNLLDLYRSSVASTRPGVFDTEFAGAIATRIETRLKEDFVNPELGRNKQAFNYIRERFVSTIFPLIETFRADPETKKFVDALLGDHKAYEQRMAGLSKQRPLTDVERAYLESVELLSLFNPYLVAAAGADFGATNEFLRHHFDTISDNTLDSLADGEYVPLIQIGTGPNGVASLGEIVRNNAMLAKSMLVVDAGNQPGGPFAVPEGPAWDLNSANRRGTQERVLPGAPLPGEELKTVRAYGSPMRWYPGERRGDSDVRAGSINMTVDYLPSPDNLSTARYPTNEQLQTILSLQTALLTERIALNTRVVKVEPAPPDLRLQGDKLVTLEITNADGTKRELMLRTDAVFVATGLGEPTYGFEYKGSKAEKIAKETDAPGKFPKVSTTLEAFRALSSRTEEYISPGETLTIWGRGNSADTLVELIGTIFQGDNPRVRNVQKIYLIADGDLSARPRYAALADLKPRNGKGNLIEFVNARVADVGYANNAGDPKDRLVSPLDEAGNAIRSASGLPIQVNAAIAATGFRPALDKVFSSYLKGNESLTKKGTREASVTPVVLPTNPEVSVADTLKADPNVVFLGTASDPRFNTSEKLLQLPVDARKALQRNGAENAVAIGFRAPDVQAAVTIWLNTREATLPAPPEKVRRVVQLRGKVRKAQPIPIPFVMDRENLKIPNNMSDERLILGPILSYELGNAVEIRDGEKGFTGELTFDLTLNGTPNAFDLTFTGGGAERISTELEAELYRVCSEMDFQRYALDSLQKKRRNRKLEIIVAFRGGKLNPQGTFVQS